MSEITPSPFVEDIHAVARRISLRAGSGVEPLAEDVETYTNYLRTVDPVIDAQERAQSLTDSGTGLLSKLGLERLYGNSLAQMRRLRAAESVLAIMLDIEGMSRANNSARAGTHAVDELLLRPFGASLDEAAREGDLVARVGGDEFAVNGFTNSTEVGIKPRIAERLARGALGRYLRTDEGQQFPLESVGVIAKAAILPVETPWHELSAHVDPKKGLQKNHEYRRLPDGASLNRVYFGSDVPTSYVWANNEGGIVVPYARRATMVADLVDPEFNPREATGAFKIATSAIPAPYMREL